MEGRSSGVAGLVWIGIVLGLGCPGGCRDETPGRAAGSREPLIGFVGASRTDPLWPVLQGGARRLARSSGISRVVFAAPPVASVQEQIRLIRQLADKGMRGLCVQVRDPDALDGVLRELNNRGVRVVAMEHDVAPELRIGFAGIDERAVGATLARTAGELFRRGTIMVLHAGTGRSAYAARYRAFERQIRLGSSVQVLGSFDCGADPVEAVRIIRRQARKYPHLDAWVAIDAWPLLGLGPAGRLFPASVKTKLITVGPYPHLWRFLEDGTCAAMIGADYGRIGLSALRFCRAALSEPVSVASIDYAPIRVLRWDDGLRALAKFRQDWASWCEPAEPEPKP